MDLGLQGKRALVTAGSRGIGRACVRALAAAGASVATCARGAADLEELRKELDGDHLLETVDLMEAGAAKRFAERALSAWGQIDVVVHNFGGTLGIGDPYSPLPDWRRVWRANFEVALELNAELVPPMVERSWGRVVFISSNAAVEHVASLPYTTAKAAMTAYARGMGRTLAASGVVMTAVLPGIVLTEDGKWAKESRKDPQGVKKFINDQLPRGTFEDPSEVADFVTFLCSERATACAGGLFQIDAAQGRGFFV